MRKTPWISQLTTSTSEKLMTFCLVKQGVNCVMGRVGTLLDVMLDNVKGKRTRLSSKDDGESCSPSDMISSMDAGNGCLPSNMMKK